MNKKANEESANSSDKVEFEERKLDSAVLDKGLKPLKPSVVVQAVAFEDSRVSAPQAFKIQSQTLVKDHVDVSPVESEVDDCSVQAEKQASSKLRKLLWIFAALLVISLSIAELYLAVSWIFTEQDWLSGAWLMLFCLIFAAALSLIFSEFKSLRRLKQQNETQQQSADLFNTPAIGLGQMHCESIARQLPSQYQPLVKVWTEGLHSHYTNTEVLSLFELKVLGPIDKLALNKITTNASAAGVMIAVSPFAMLDMVIVLWRNIKMINQLSNLYGVRLGYWGRVALIKKIFRSMLYAGAAEILSDAGNYALGLGLTGKISTRVAQGMGAGVLTSRIGLQALHECRPMPWLSVTKPGLSKMTNQLLEDLTNYLK